MPNWGLLGAVGEGLKSGVESYRTERDYQTKKALEEADRKQKDQLMQADLLTKGLLRSESGEISQSPEYFKDKARKEAIDQAGLMKTGNRLGTYDAEKREFPIEAIPGYRNIEDDYKRALIKLTDAKATEARAGPKPAKTTADERRVSTYARRLEESEKIFSDLETKGYDGTSMGAQISRKMPGLLEGLKSSENKQQEQAERNFINAVLRRESGSAILPSEFESAEKQYFPRHGDPPELLAQKRRNREIVVEGFRNESGDAYANAYGAPPAAGLVGRGNDTPRGLINSKSVASPAAPAKQPKMVRVKFDDGTSEVMTEEAAKQYGY